MTEISRKYLRDIAMTITFALGFFILLDYFVVWPAYNNLARTLISTTTVMMGLAGLVGIGNLTRIHLRNIGRRGENWIPSCLLLVSLYLPLIIGLLFTRKNETYAFIYSSLYRPISSAFFATLGFFILSAAYRSFRIKNFDSAVMVFCAAIVFMGNAPIFGLLWKGFPDLSLFLLLGPNAAGFRGIAIGIAIGTIIVGIRTLIGRETGYLQQKEAET